MLSWCTKSCERCVAKQQFPLRGSTIFAFGPPRQCMLPDFLKVMRGFLRNLHFKFLVLQFARCHRPVSPGLSQSFSRNLRVSALLACDLDGACFNARRKEEDGAASAAAGLHRSSSNCHASTQKDDKGTILM